MTDLLHRLIHRHRPVWAWCYYGMTIARAGSIRPHLFCRACYPQGGAA